MGLEDRQVLARKAVVVEASGTGAEALVYLHLNCACSEEVASFGEVALISGHYECYACGKKILRGDNA